MKRLVVVDDVGVVNELESGRGARGGVVVTDVVDVVDTEAVLVRGELVAVDVEVVSVRDEVVVDEVDVVEVEAVGTDEDESSVT